MAVPTVPTSVSATVVKGGAVVRWASPATPNGAITGYAVDMTPTGGGATVTVETAETLANLAFADLGLAPGTSWDYKVRARNASGLSAFSSTATAVVPARTFLDTVRIASVQVQGGTMVELRSDGAATPVITLGYSKVADGTTFTAIGILPTAVTQPGRGVLGPSGSFAITGAEQDLALVANKRGDVYVIGRTANSASAILARAYTRGGTTLAPTDVWTARQQLSSTLIGANSGAFVYKFAATYDPGFGVSPAPTPSLVVLARWGGRALVKHLSYATLNVAALNAGTGSLIIAQGMDPAFLPAATTSFGAVQVEAALDIVVTPTGGPYAYAVSNGVSMLFIQNGVVSGNSQAPAGTIVPVSSSGRARIIGISNSDYALLSDQADGLHLDFYAQAGPTGSAVIAAAAFLSGASAERWDAVYNQRTGLVSVYAMTAARTLSRYDVSPLTFLASAPTVISAAIGAVGSTNIEPRVPHGSMDDDRRILIEFSSSLAGVQSLAVLDDRSGDIAPNAPALTPRSNFDAVLAATFAWTFSDPNAGDTQTAYQLLIEKVSDGTTAFDSGKVASTTSSRVLAGGTLTNGTAYRWKVRTYDNLDIVGPYSSYGTFTPSALGTLTITDPAADGAALNTSSYPLTWTYVQSNGFTQAQRRVRLFRTSDGATLLDTTMQASTALTYTLTGLPSGVEVRAQVDIINSNAQAPAAVTRTFTSTYASPQVPTFTATPTENYIEVVVDNPAPVGSLPEAASNLILRRLSGSSDDWTIVTSVGHNGSFQDRQVASGRAYDYMVTAVAATGSTSSDIGGAVAPDLMGVWIHTVADPEASEWNYVYQSAARQESLEVSTSFLAFVGRTFPVAEFGESEVEAYKLGVKIPWGDDHDLGKEHLRVLKRLRTTLCYRDNRGRVVFGVIDGALGFEDSDDAGTVASFGYQRVDYVEGV